MKDEILTVFSVEEQRLAVERVAETLRPLGIRVMVLGRVAMLYLFEMGQASKDVDIHPFPMEDQDLLDVQERLGSMIQDGGGHLRWEPDGRSMTVHVPIEGRLVPVEIVLGGEDWISPEVLEDAVRTGIPVGNVMVPTPEHLLVMKAEAFFDRRAEHGVERFRNDMLDIVEGTNRFDIQLDIVEVGRLVMMRPERKHDVMMALCASVLPE